MRPKITLLNVHPTMWGRALNCARTFLETPEYVDGSRARQRDSVLYGRETDKIVFSVWGDATHMRVAQGLENG